MTSKTLPLPGSKKPKRRLRQPGDRPASTSTSKRRSTATKPLRAVEVGTADATLGQMVRELDSMKDVLMGRTDPPIQKGLITLMEVADAYLSRSLEMSMELHRRQREGLVEAKSPAQLFRTGELRDFIDLCKRAVDLGSRRITFGALTLEAEQSGRSSLIEAIDFGSE